MNETATGCESGLADLLAAVQAFRAASRPARNHEQLQSDLRHLRTVCDLLELTFADWAATFAASCDENVVESPVGWLRQELNMATQRAADAITVGEQASALPASVDAVKQGEIGFDHLCLMARTARALNSSSTASAPFNEGPLLARALKHNVTRFRRDCAHVRHAADMEAFLTEHASEVEWRRLELRDCGDGALSVRGFFDSVGGAAIMAALGPLARRSGADDHRERDRRWADALVELAHHGLDKGELPTHGGQRPHLQITAQLETLLAQPGSPAGELEFSAPVPAATVQRLACDATVSRILLGPDSAVVDVGRGRRLPSGPTRRALVVRDGGCVWPGCARPASWTAAHHLRHWAHGGETNLSNLVLICYRHHWMVHEGGWQIVRTDEGITTIPPVFGASGIVDGQPRAPDGQAAA